MPKHSVPVNNSPIVLAIQAEARHLGFTAYRLAQMTGLRIYTMQRLLSGTGSPTLSTLEAVAKALDMDLKLEKCKPRPFERFSQRR